MASTAGQFRARPYFVALAIIIALIYGLVFVFGDHKPSPKLGLDLVGGTSATLQAQTLNHTNPTSDSMNVARGIIAQRVNSTGVTEADVRVVGNSNIVVNVAGQNANKNGELEKLLRPAKLEFRTVLGLGQDQPQSSATPSATPSGSTSPSGSTTGTPTTGSSTPPAVAPSQSPHGDAAVAAPAAPKPAVAPSTTPTSPAAKPSGSTPASSPSASPSPTPTPSPLKGAPTLDEVKAIVGPAVFAQAQQLTAAPTGDQIAAYDSFYKLNSDQIAVLPANIQFYVPQVTCKKLNDRNSAYLTDPSYLNVQVVACGDPSTNDARTKYLLDAAHVQGQMVSSASANYDLQNEGGWYVSLNFTGDGQAAWSKLTGEQVNNQVAIVLDTNVVSAPQIKQQINGPAVINGTGINEQTSSQLATQLKFGALPIDFKLQTLENVSATLGLQQLEYGLLAGAIGLALVILYCFVYYRALGFVVIASLVVSGVIVFGMLVLLGRSMGFTLSLAGIAGFIVAIGITADSFVVFFERLKDEVREGRTVRSAVPRAWVRARRTILSADAVSFLAAVVLYWLAADQVRGFAFTLGLSTVIDLIVVFLFTHPLVHVLSGSRTFTSPKFSGLGTVREGASGDAAAPTTRVGSMRTKES